MKYNIAFLTYDWNTEIAGQFTKGIRMYIDEHPNVTVHLFSGFGSYRSNDIYEASLQIFNLPYLSNYDGVILQGNRVWNPTERNKLVERAASYGVPVVSINYPLEGTTLVGSDNYQSSYALTEHLIVKHHCKTLAVLAGLPSSKEAQERKKGALDCAVKYGIPDVKVYGNEWDEEYGAEAARTMIAEGNVPEGIVCGNDNLAFGCETELLKNGIRIPEDVKITGYDDLSVAAAAPIRITTVDRNFPRVAYTAMNTVIDLADGKEVERVIHPKEDMIFSSSCGCGDKANEVSVLKEKYLRANRYVYDYYKLHNGLSVMLDKARTLSDIAEAMEVNADAFQSGAIYVVLNGLYLENFGNTNPIRHYGNNMVLIGMSDPEEFKCDERHVYATFSRQFLLPEEILNKKKMLQVYSLQAEETCIGYIVTDGFTSRMEFNFLETAFSLLDNAIERVRRASVMESLNTRLSMLYITDPLTGLFNRFGLEQKGRLLYDQLINEDKKAYICFIDIDDLKKINDRYGHECGDDAIIRTSQVIVKGLKNNTSAFAMRYGGDEFVVIGDTSMKDDLIAQMKLEKQEASHYPYLLDASIGEVEVQKSDGLTLQKAIESADDTMYGIKKQRKEDAKK
jgi:diguanylate cyclase (GGDEF)-like protein